MLHAGGRERDLRNACIVVRKATGILHLRYLGIDKNIILKCKVILCK